MMTDLEAQAGSSFQQKRDQLVLELVDLIAHRRTLPEVFHETAVKLQRVLALDFIHLFLHDPASNTMHLHLWESVSPSLIPRKESVKVAGSGWVWQNRQPLFFPDLQKETRFPETLDRLREAGCRSYCLLPIIGGEDTLAVLGLGSSSEPPYGRADSKLMERVAALTALAMENARVRQVLKEDMQRVQAVLKVSSAMVTHLDLDALLPALGEGIRGIANSDYASLVLREGTAFRLYPLIFPLGQEAIAGEVAPLQEAPAGRAILHGETKLLTRTDLAALNSPFGRRLLEAGVQFLWCIPLKSAKGVLGSLNLGSSKEQSIDPDDLSLLAQIASPLAASLENARAFREASELRNKLQEEKLYLQDEIRSALNCEEIIGDDPSIRKVLSQVKTIAATDATVLIMGETGTGKELVARAIHRMSQRRNRSFIKMNCAAIPPGLLESELFGHEKGAYTGAARQKIGRVELADKGTLFLDEVGDLALQVQPKLLRLLQDQEFERLGSTRAIRVNVRLVAATNRDLVKSIAERQFSSDLFYRLHVFPIHLAPLRERRQDIPLLVRHFTQKFARRMGKSIETITSESMNKMMQWDWPGNIRELENFVERAVILTEGSVLQVPVAELQRKSS